ncbi:hypothetical protein KP509_1Z065800 [Ceratopteris richardii]|nr:hypothetical protein KP509_1Z065800 [Ceratopteris richardii]
MFRISISLSLSPPPEEMYAAAVWAPGITEAMLTQIERPQITMISRLLRSKPSVPHDIIRAELGTPPMLVEALFQLVTFILRVRELPTSRLTRLAFESSRHLAETGHEGVWYAQTYRWLADHGMGITDLPPFQYDLSSPHITLSRSERNRIIRQDLLQIHVRETWIAPREPLPTKRQHYREHFLTVTADGFIQRPRYMDTYMAPAERVAIGQLRLSSHQLEIEIGRATHTPRDERLCRICREEVEDEEHYTCRCQAYEDIRDRYPQLFRGPREIRALLGTEDQRPLGRFLVELQRRRGSLLQQQMEIHLAPPLRLILQIFSDPHTLEGPARCGVSHYTEQRSLDDSVDDRDPLSGELLHIRERFRRFTHAITWRYRDVSSAPLSIWTPRAF